jgi:hypothetical protein
MNRFVPALLLALLAGPAFAQSKAPEITPYYPAPPPDQAPKVEKGVAIDNLTSPLAQDNKTVARTVIDSDAEAQMFAGAARVGWGRYKSHKHGTVAVTKGTVWTVKGRIDGVGEGDWASIDGVVEHIAANNITIRGEVAFRVGKVEQGKPCKAAGVLHFRRSGKSQVWRLVEGDNPCDGTQEQFDLVYEKPATEKKPVPAQPVPRKS